MNRLLYDLFDRGEEMFVGDYCEDYSETQERPFLIEKPVIHYLPGEDLEMYRKAEREAGRDLFTYKPSADCYRGVHYLINYKGIYMEIQARLISDDLWSEIEHDTVYKLEKTQKKDLLKGCASLLRGMLLACDFLSLYMREKAESNEKTESQEDKLKAIQRLEECWKYVGEAQEQMGLLLKREKEDLADETRSE